MNTYIQNKLDEFDKRFSEEIILDQEVRTVVPGIKHFIKQSLTDYHNHIVEKIDKLNKDAEKFVPFQKIHYQSALIDLKSLLQDTNPKE